MRIIGITGPTGAGKTTALSALEELGGAVIDCDAVYHRLLCENTQMLAELRERFGSEIFQEDGRLDRKKLGSIVFRDERALTDLNRITHRYVSEEVDRLLMKAEEEGKPAAAVDAIALLESGLKDKCHSLLAVIAPADTRIERIMAREGISREYAQTRVAAQKPDSYFEEHCHHIFYNDCSDACAAKNKALELFQRILKEELL